MAHETTILDRQRILRALDAGSIVGVGPLLERAIACPLGTAVSTADKVRLAHAVREQIHSGVVASYPLGGTVQLALTSHGRRLADELRQRHPRSRLSILTLAAGCAALLSVGCSPIPRQMQRGPSIGFPTPVGVHQVRDADGHAVYEPCNPCACPSVKTPVLGGYASDAVFSLEPAGSTTHFKIVNQQHTMAPSTTQKQPVLATPAVQPLTKQPVADDIALQEQTKAGVPMVKDSRNILFAFGSSRLSTDSIEMVRAFATVAMSAPAVYVRGSTDAQGSVLANEVLAKNRAASVREELVAQGIRRDRIITSYCTSCYRSDNTTEAGRRANRRVELSVTAPSSPANNTIYP